MSLESQRREGEALGDKLKELCKWKSDTYGREMETLAAIVSEPRFVCLKCGRAAERKKWLCKPEKLPESRKSSG